MKWILILALSLQALNAQFPIFVRHGQLERIPIIGPDVESNVPPWGICAISSTMAGPDMSILTFAKCIDFRPHRADALESSGCSECGYKPQIGEVMPLAVEAWGEGNWRTVSLGVRQGLPTPIPSGVPIRFRTLGIRIFRIDKTVFMDVPPGVLEKSSDFVNWSIERYSNVSNTVTAVKGLFYRMKY